MGSGLYVRDYGVHPEVRESCVRFARWIRQEIDFPRRFVVYLHPRRVYWTRGGEEVWAAFFAPPRQGGYAYARVSAQEYRSFRRVHGRQRALLHILDSFAHELVHYEQWRDRRALIEQGVVNRTRALLRRYLEEVSRP